MSGKRVLVVDDSKSARVILRKMLEQYDLAVDSAESAEEALDYLRHRRPDAIFMDHMMPGMDGLEAVRIIKDDPKTATIPIMMYTSKEGEVYVGQARALGAVGILPKEVEPAELFKILRRINLVPERRMQQDADTDAEITVIDDASDLPLAAISEISRIAVETAEASHSARHAQLKQLFEAQREKLQADFEAMRQATGDAEPDAGTGASGRGWVSGIHHAPARRWFVPAIIALFVALFFSPAIWLSDRFDDLENELEDVRSELLARSEALPSGTGGETFGLPAGEVADAGQGPMNDDALLEAIEWALNRGGRFEADGPALGDAQKEMLQGLLSYLASAGFRGEVRLGVRFGEFCMTRNAYGTLEIAPAELPIDQCDVIGRRADPGPQLASEQTVSFGSFLASSPLVNSGDIHIAIYPVTADDDTRHPGLPGSNLTAGEWNRIAQLDNRIEISLVPAEADR